MSLQNTSTVTYRDCFNTTSGVVWWFE